MDSRAGKSSTATSFLLLPVHQRGVCLKILKYYKEILIGLILFLVAVTAMGVLVYNYTMQESGIDEPAATDYQYYYVLVTDNAEMSFWQATYETMKEEAALHDAYIEILGDNLTTDYSLAEKIRIAIESDVDGIILEPNDDPELITMIEEASRAGIPVVTVISDQVMSERISYVGTNSYDLGKEYGEQVLGAINQETEPIEEIVVLVDEAKESSGDYTIYTQIKEMVERRHLNRKIEITAVPIDTSSSFDAENEIRDYLISQEKDPDLVVCLNAVNTVCVYQAVVDFNLVGKVQIIGDHFSDTILKAIKMGNIYSTLVLNSERMGEYAINALSEYRSMGYASEFYRVDVAVIDKNSVDSFISSRETSEKEVGT